MESTYLDAVAENWCLLINESYSEGMPLPYVVRAGQKVLYIPIYMRYIVPYNLDVEKSLPLLRQHFSDFEFSLDQPLDGMQSNSIVYQQITTNDEPVLSTQAKRMLKKAQQAGFEAVIGDEIEEVLKRIESELSGKISGINQKSMIHLKTLMKSYQKLDRLLVFSIEGVGGVVCIRNMHSLLYLKGAVDEQSKRNGAMYLLMKTAIDYAGQHNLNFDFGGSRAEGVKKFNHNLGGKDCVYYQIIESGGPIWYKLAKRLKRRWIKK